MSSKEVFLSKYPIGTQVEIVQADGFEVFPSIIATDPIPQAIGMRGVIEDFEEWSEEIGTPMIRLDNGKMILGTECWWKEVK